MTFLRYASALLAATACAACSMTYSGAPEGPGSATFQLNQPFTVPPPAGSAISTGMPGGLVTTGYGDTLPPPANLIPPPPLGSPPAPAQGRYDGRSEVMYGGAFRDCQPLDMTNFKVEGRTVYFGPFQGRIRPDGSVAMQAGPTYISGQFEGSHFQGRYWAPPPNCTFSLSFDPVAR